MGLRICPQCSSTSIEVHEGRGETICTNCGTVLEENTMVEGLQFSECSNGSMQMVGHFVPSSGVRGFAMVYGNRESREHVLQRGYHNLQRIADQLRLSSSHIESAQRVFLMAVQRSFTIGRNNMHVASACLYAICRREKTPHMLIDFSDVLQTPVKVLGQVFMKLLRLLRLHVPNIDPSMFMERFAAQMKLGEKTHAVAATGVRIVQALTRNWITTGRRPTGLCGAALLISARYHGIPVSSSEIAQIVRISSPTLLKRLAEFKHTSTAQLTADEFENTDLLSLPIVRGPPCFEKNRLKDEANKALAISNGEDKLAIEGIDSEADLNSKYNKGNEPLGNDEDKKKGDREVQEEEQDDEEEEEEESEPIDIEADDLEGSRKNLSFPKFLGGIELDINQDKLCNDEPTSQDITNIASKLINAFDKAKCASENSQSGASTSTGSTSAEEDLAMDPLHFLFKDFGDFHVETEDKQTAKESTQGEGNNERLIESTGGEKINIANSDLSTTISSSGYEDHDNITSSDDLSEISDSEINDLLLDEDEREAKRLLWDEITKDTLPPSWLRKINKESINSNNYQHNGILEVSDNTDTGITGTGQLKKRKTDHPEKESSKAQKVQPENAIESVLMALQKAGPGATKHVNSDTLAKLFTVC
ncbi:cyclin domain-containing protein [Cryptosporidium ubiquitum]|uniref:B-related factor 1 n=1 Tax=Cryptosporidium ubiquitum TaxID=857276 RepID=A0A1J4MN54_9CRYT|nr:cyclin domain-containing protein [Cryptosporidium ubiquitum]OII75600.1 cyclin domain-containing protein [Cryptosporidium ubiquitum]